MPYKLAEAFVEINERGLGGVLGGIGNLNNQLGVLDNVLGKVGMSFAGFSAIGVGAIGVLGVAIGTKAITAVSRLEDALAEVSTLVDVNEVSMKQMEDAVIAMSTKVRKSSVELSNGLYQVISAGVQVGESFSVLDVSARAASAGLTDTFTAVDVLTTVLNAYSLEASEAEHISDLLFGTVKEGKTKFGELAGSLGRLLPIASDLKVPLDELLGIIAHLTKGGLSTSESVTALRSAMMEFVKPAESVSKVLGSQSHLMSSSAVQSKGLVRAFNDLRVEAERSGVQISDLIGRQEALLAISRTTGDQMESVAESIKSVGDSVGETDVAFGKITGTLSAQVDLLKLQINKALIELGEEILPMVTDAMKGLNTIVGFFTQSTLERWSQSLDKSIQATQQQWQEAQNLEGRLNPLVQRYDELRQKIDESGESTVEAEGYNEELRKVVSEIASIVPEAATGFDRYGEALDVSTKAAYSFIEVQKAMSLDKTIDAIKNLDDKTAKLNRTLDTLEIERIIAPQMEKYAKEFGRSLEEVNEAARKTKIELDGIKVRQAKLFEGLPKNVQEIVNRFAALQGTSVDTEQIIIDTIGAGLADSTKEAQKLLETLAQIAQPIAFGPPIPPKEVVLTPKEVPPVLDVEEIEKRKRRREELVEATRKASLQLAEIEARLISDTEERELASLKVRFQIRQSNLDKQLDLLQGGTANEIALAEQLYRQKTALELEYQNERQTIIEKAVDERDQSMEEGLVFSKRINDSELKSLQDAVQSRLGAIEWEKDEAKKIGKSALKAKEKELDLGVKIALETNKLELKYEKQFSESVIKDTERRVKEQDEVEKWLQKERQKRIEESKRAFDILSRKTSDFDGTVRDVMSGWGNITRDATTEIEDHFINVGETLEALSRSFGDVTMQIGSFTISIGDAGVALQGLGKIAEGTDITLNEGIAIGNAWQTIWSGIGATLDKGGQSVRGFVEEYKLLAKAYADNEEASKRLRRIYAQMMTYTAGGLVMPSKEDREWWKEMLAKTGGASLIEGIAEWKDAISVVVHDTVSEGILSGLSSIDIGKDIEEILLKQVFEQALTAIITKSMPLLEKGMKKWSALVIDAMQEASEGGVEITVGEFKYIEAAGRELKWMFEGVAEDGQKLLDTLGLTVDETKKLKTEAGKRITGGITISQITGPTRDILVSTLSPLKQLNTTFPAMLDELRVQTALLSGISSMPIEQIANWNSIANQLGISDGGIVVEGDIIINVTEESDLTSENINESLQREVAISRRRKGAT